MPPRIFQPRAGFDVRTLPFFTQSRVFIIRLNQQVVEPPFLFAWVTPQVEPVSIERRGHLTQQQPGRVFLRTLLLRQHENHQRPSQHQDDDDDQQDFDQGEPRRSVVYSYSIANNHSSGSSKADTLKQTPQLSIKFMKIRQKAGPDRKSTRLNSSHVA